MSLSSHQPSGTDFLDGATEAAPLDGSRASPVSGANPAPDEPSAATSHNQSVAPGVDALLRRAEVVARPVILRALRGRRLGGMSPADVANDAVQETLWRVAARAETSAAVPGGAAFFQYVRLVALQEVLRAMQDARGAAKAAVATGGSGRPGDGEISDSVAHATDTSENASTGAMASPDAVRAALASLREIDQHVVLRRAVQDAGWAALARELGTTRDGARRRYQRACEALRRALGVPPLPGAASRARTPDDDGDPAIAAAVRGAAA
jgi:DNA-directed RNA polymerase specialized sigma24 family protein